MKKIAAVVILYNPEQNVIDNIKTYVDYVNRLYVIDNGNGSKVCKILQENFNNIEIIYYKENKGIAFPLNDVLNRVNNKFDFLMTMDQDSFFEKNSIYNYIKYINNFSWDDVLCFGPCIETYTFNNYQYDSILFKKSLSVIQSGAIFNIKNTVSINGFDENLFIDEVDNEICYRAWMLKKLKIYKCFKGVYLNHTFGEQKIIKFFNHKICYTDGHNHIRIYYIIRNRWLIYWKYHNINELYFFKVYIYYTFKLIFKKIIFEPNKALVLKSFFIGIYDAIFKKFGKIL